MKTYHFFYILLLASLMMACSEEDPNNFERAASLKVVHTAVETPGLHVDYFNNEITFSFANNPVLSFGNNTRLTLAANTERTLNLVSAIDTTQVLLSTRVTLSPGAITSLYLIGEGATPEALLVEDDLITPIQDSITGVRFANLSPDSGPITVGISGDTQTVIPELSYQDFSVYTPFSATTTDGSYAFEFRDAGGTVLASFTLDPFQRRNVSVKRNLTLALTGKAENNTLSVARVNNY